jgi:hypothetical protein
MPGEAIGKKIVNHFCYRIWWMVSRIALFAYYVFHKGQWFLISCTDIVLMEIEVIVDRFVGNPRQWEFRFPQIPKAGRIPADFQLAGVDIISAKVLLLFEFKDKQQAISRCPTITLPKVFVCKGVFPWPGPAVLNEKHRKPT